MARMIKIDNIHLRKGGVLSSIFSNGVHFFMRQFQQIYQVSQSGAISYLDIKRSPRCRIA